MIELSKVTLVFIDCVYPKRTLRALDYCTKDCSFAAIKILTSKQTPGRSFFGTDERAKQAEVIEIPHIDSLQKYSKFCLLEMHKYIDTDFVLIAQADGFIINAQAWQDDFLSYDYIGAPWWFYQDEYSVGNGGFSLRSKRLLEYLAENFVDDVNIYHPEDHCICRAQVKEIMRAGFKFAPGEVANKFSVENGRWNGQFGFHSFSTDITAWDGFKEFNVDPNIRAGI